MSTAAVAGATEGPPEIRAAFEQFRAAYPRSLSMELVAARNAFRGEG